MDQWNEFLQDTFAGSLGGVTFVLSAHPFEQQLILDSSTIKVRMQMVSENTSILKTAYKIFKYEGPFAFYKGVVSPLLFSFPVSATLFACYEQYMRYFQVDRDSYQLMHWGVGGVYAGFIQSFVTSPSELFKIVFQMQISERKRNSVLRCMLEFVQKEGIAAVFKGVNSTIFRDIPQYSTFFIAFESTKQYLQSQKGYLNIFDQFLAGIAAGLVCICFSYPQDMVKTKIQYEILESKQNRKFQGIDGGISKCIKEIYKVGGFKGFWQGFNSCAIYYMVACSAQLVGYEQGRIFWDTYVKH
ncbi:unnamed protein product (macronuclear) [Paramecium tetraurelia]|uniref:Mitochondrial carrier protein n=1 Tax=Paramecium tetraurelia TaxID=5888 RepID=A0D085_PARTE|nr:uncharacterized protein GSPATT00012004001 [Paramecium tetraurelia]CAK76452.1 unnamed protein product [Paramecium tetraurelia]|eukprot:XP_001443849.1 hypothetical protein (macronuclear) [Paramecium tetraurelia strain d4-2]